MTIPILIPSVPRYESLEKYIKLIDESRHYTNFGQLENTLRSRFSNIWGVEIEKIATAANATLALQGAIATSENQNDFWSLPSWTFTATALAAKRECREFKFIDVAETTWRAAFDPYALNVIDVLPFGDCLDFSRFEQNTSGCVVVDAAASIASLLQPLPSIKKKFAIVVSLHATKLLPAGEGALFVSNCKEWTQRFRAWSNFGFNGNRISVLFGTNAKLSEYSAAIALAALDSLSDVLSKLSTIQKLALDITLNSGNRVHPAMQKGITTPYWIVEFSSAEDKIEKQKLFEMKQIQTLEWWGKGCHKNPIFGKESSSLVRTEDLANRTLGLPMHTYLTDNDLSQIAEVLMR